MYHCRICNIENPDNNHFYKVHKITIKNYFETYENRHDLFDNSIIEFKGSQEDYFTKSFNSKFTLKKWLEKVSKEEYERYVYTYLIDRKARKKLLYSPCQVELRSLLLPGIKWINEHIKDYYLLCEELGFINRFTKYDLDKNLFKDISNKVIFTDKREQKNLDFNLQNRFKSMSVGDYRTAFSDIRIERKSIGDLYSTVSGGLERFKKEILRAKEQKNYLIVLVEQPFNNIYAFSKLPHLKNKKLPAAEFVIHNIREILEQNNFVQFLFVKDREEAGKMIEYIFSADSLIKEVDLQLMYDIGKINLNE